MRSLFPNLRELFQRERNGATYKFEIREAVASEENNVVDFLLKYFMKDEHCNNVYGINEDPLAKDEFHGLMKIILKQKYHLVCMDITNSQEPKIIGVNLMEIITKNEKPDDPNYKSIPMQKLGRMFEYISNEAKDIFKTFSVSEYLAGAGISTDPAYRNMGIATEMLLARDLLCKSLGLKLSSASFTGVASQKLAVKCGYEPFVDVDYEELGKALDVNFNSPAKSIRVMTKVFST